MQIHELASLSTALASGTFFAVDNGSVTRKLDFGNLATGLAGNGAMTRNLYLNVADWSDIKTKIESIATTSSASFYATSEVANLLVGGKITAATMKGVIYRNSGTYDIMAMLGAGGAYGQMVTFRITGVTTSGATVGDVRVYVSTASDGAADSARAGMEAPYAKYYYTPSGTSFTLNIPNSTRALIVISDYSIANNGIFIAVSNSSGSVNVVDVFTGSLTYDKSVANKLTFTRTTTGQNNVMVLNLKNNQDSIPTLDTNT